MSKPFCAIDGEGYTDDSGNHLFNLLGASDGTYIHNDKGLSTRECLTYLLDIKTRNPDSTFVSFVFTYDVNKILKDLTEDSKDKLAEKGHVYIRDRVTKKWFHLDYKPRKWFLVSEVINGKDNRGKQTMKAVRTIKIFDTFGFFQTSFVNALRTFHVGTTEELEFIRTMKLERSEFTSEAIDAIRRYNLCECKLLTELMDTVRFNLQQIGINLSSWHGAGAVAGAVLKREKVMKHFYKPQTPETEDMVMGSYYGGRVQALRIGRFRETYGYDIVSAYPSAMATLASLEHGTERVVYEFVPDYPYAIYDVSWELPTSHSLPPLPFRNTNGTIEYPYCGRGRYYFAEVDAAMRVHGRQYFTINSGLLFENVDTSTRPFRFIPPMFEFRKQLKAEGNMAQLCIKLALNSLYGKLAQGEGYRGRTPAYQCYIYAGMITSITRAAITLACGDNPDVISIATDGVLTTSPLDVSVGDRLGQWESATYERCMVVKPGIYRLESGAKTVTKVRGFPTAAMIDKWPELEAVWDREGVAGELALAYDQFIGIKSASAARPHGQWVSTEKTISLYPARGFPVMESSNPLQYRVHPTPYCEGISMAYRKVGDVDLTKDEFGIGEID